MTFGALRDARDQVRRLEQAHRKHAALLAQLADIRRELGELQIWYEAEQNDVRRIEGPSLTSSIVGMLGNREERLAQERAEADIARLRVEGHQAYERHLSRELAALDREIAGLADAPRRYEQRLADATTALRAAGDPRVPELVKIDIELADVSADLREHEEAYHACQAAFFAINQVLEPLDRARQWAKMDMIGLPVFGSGETDNLRHAAAVAWPAQQALDWLAREMYDVDVHVRPQLPYIETRWYADVFDILRHKRIVATAQRVTQIAQWLHATGEWLNLRRSQLSQRRAALQSRRESLHGLR